MNDKYKPKGEKGIIVDPERFPIVRKMWDHLLQKKRSVRQLALLAQEEYGLTSHSGKPVPMSVIYIMFKNPFYYGQFRYMDKIWNGTHTTMITKEEFDTAQEIMSSKSIPKFKKHLFAFTTLIRCGECGSMITAEHKVKRQKNGNVHNYTYYHCTKKHGACTQKHVREKVLLDQIEKKVDSISIPKEFKEWALEVIREDELKDAKLNTQQLALHRKDYDTCLGRLQNLKQMRIDLEIDAEEFAEQKNKLLAEKEQVLTLINELDSDINTKVKRLEEKLTVAEKAKIDYESGDLFRQRNVLVSIGSNFLLRDDKLTFSLEDIFESVRTCSKEVKKLHSAFEPLKNKYDKGDYAKMYSSSLELGAIVEDVRTVFERRNDATIYIPTFYPTLESTI